MTIGTAVPDASQLAAVKHYFIQDHTVAKMYTAGVYELEAIDLIEKLFAEGHETLVMAGGSMFYVDAVCDVSGSHKSNRFRPLHVNAIVGVGLMAVGEKKLLGTMKTPQEIGEEITYDEKTGRPFVAGLPMFQGLVKTKSTISPALRLGLLFDYRVDKNVSVNVEPLITVGNDNVDGIKYAEPFDFLVNIKGGLTYHF